MRTEFTVKEGNPDLVVIFAGWSTTPGFYRHIHPEGYDVAVVWDYSDIELDDTDFSKYRNICVFAWSLGVFMASLVMSPSMVCLAVAVNGTTTPVSDNYGIPERVFDGTSENLNLRNLEKFRRRLGGKDYNAIKDSFPDSNITKLVSELSEIRNLSRLIPFPDRFTWDIAYVSENDAIFPPANQFASWHRLPHTEAISIPGNHYVDLAEVVCNSLPSKKKVGESFHRALPTYSSSASVQKKVAHNLVDILPDFDDYLHPYRDILEIGPGDGTLTRRLASRFPFKNATFVDLYKLPEFGLAESENYIIADAEEYIYREARVNPGSRDLIISSSAFQWFVNPSKFIRNARTVLREGGILALSSYLPGTLKELRPVNPIGLPYRNMERLSEIMQFHFSEYEILEFSESIAFESVKEALAHLRATGASGSPYRKSELRTLLESLPPSLTYNPVCMLAIKPVSPPRFFI